MSLHINPTITQSHNLAHTQSDAIKVHHMKHKLPHRYDQTHSQLKSVTLHALALSETKQTCTEKGKMLRCTLVQARRLCTDRTAPRGSRGIALLFLDHSNRKEWVVSVTPRPFFTPGKEPVPIVHQAGWAPGPVWTGAENLAPQRNSIPGPFSP